jgi:hypothetical protein
MPPKLSFARPPKFSSFVAVENAVTLRPASSSSSAAQMPARPPPDDDDVAHCPLLGFLCECSPKRALARSLRE